MLTSRRPFCIQCNKLKYSGSIYITPTACRQTGNKSKMEDGSDNSDGSGWLLHRCMGIVHSTLLNVWVVLWIAQPFFRLFADCRRLVLEKNTNSAVWSESEIFWAIKWKIIIIQFKALFNVENLTNIIIIKQVIYLLWLPYITRCYTALDVNYSTLYTQPRYTTRIRRDCIEPRSDNHYRVLSRDPI